MICKKCDARYSILLPHTCDTTWIVCGRDDFYFEGTPGVDYLYPDATYRSSTREGAAEQWAKHYNENGDHPLSHGETPVAAVWEEGQDKSTATFFRCEAEVFTTYSAAECGEDDHPD